MRNQTAAAGRNMNTHDQLCTTYIGMRKIGARINYNILCARRSMGMRVAKIMIVIAKSCRHNYS